MFIRDVRAPYDVYLTVDVPGGRSARRPHASSPRSSPVPTTTDCGCTSSRRRPSGGRPSTGASDHKVADRLRCAVSSSIPAWSCTGAVTHGTTGVPAYLRFMPASGHGGASSRRSRDATGAFSARAARPARTTCSSCPRPPGSRRARKPEDITTASWPSRGQPIRGDARCRRTPIVGAQGAADDRWRAVDAGDHQRARQLHGPLGARRGGPTVGSVTPPATSGPAPARGHASTFDSRRRYGYATRDPDHRTHAGTTCAARPPRSGRARHRRRHDRGGRHGHRRHRGEREQRVGSRRPPMAAAHLPSMLAARRAAVGGGRSRRRATSRSARSNLGGRTARPIDAPAMQPVTDGDHAPASARSGGVTLDAVPTEALRARRARRDPRTSDASG